MWHQLSHTSLSTSLQGGVVYANYGRPQDFNWLKSRGVSVVGSLVVMRVGGGVSFAEKVWLAEKNRAGGVLIYPDPADLPQDPRRLGLSTHTAVSEHVRHIILDSSWQVHRLLTSDQSASLSTILRSTWAQVTPLPPDFLPSITHSSRASSPQACHSSQLFQ